MLRHWKAISIFLCLAFAMTPAAKLSADPAATEPATAPSQDLLAQAGDLFSTACNDLHAGKSDQALAEFRAAADLYAKAYGTQETNDVAACLNGEGSCLDQLGRDADALPIHKAALDICRRIHKNQDDPDVASALVNLAACLDNLGREDDALAAYREALEMKQRLCNGQDDPDVATTENCVGYCLFSLGRYEQALPVFRATLEMRERLYKNRDQIDVVSSLNNLAKCLDALGRGAEALPIYQSALDMTRRLCNNQDSPDFAAVMDNVAQCMESLGRYDDALPMFRTALDMRRRICKGQDDTDVAGSLNDLATCLGALGRSEEALEKCQAALDMLQRIHKGQDSPEVATALGNVAQCLEALGRSGEALPDHEAALDMRRRIYDGQDHPEIAESLNNLAGCFTSLGRHADALAAYQAALEMFQRIYKDQDHPDVATALSNAAVALDNLDRFADALPLHQQALEMSRRLYKDQDHPSVAMYLSLLAGCQISVDRPAEALPNSQAALEMQKRIYKERDHPIVAWSISVVGKCLRELGRKQEALATYQAAMAMSERLSDPVSYNYSSRVGDILFSMGKSAEAVAAYDKSINAFEQARTALGGDEQDRMKFMDQNELDDFDAFDGIVRAELALNRPDKAAEYLDRGRAKCLLDRLERAQRQSGGDLLSPIEARAQKAQDWRLLQETKEAATALAAADERVRQLISQINYARSINSADADAQIDELQPKLREACGQYAEAHRRALNLVGATTVAESTSAQQIRSFLKPGQHLLMYSIIDQAVIVIPPAGQAISAARLTDTDGKTPLSGAALIRPIWAYQKAIISHGQSFTRGAKLVHDDAATRPTDDMAQDGYDLFRRLMPAEVWRQIKDDDLVFVVPDWEMNGLPLETLIVQKPEKTDAKNNQYWLDRGPPICYGPSAAALLKLCRQEARHPTKAFVHQAVLLGDPVLQRDAPVSADLPPAVAQTRDASLGAYGPLSPLPGTRTEVTGIYRVLTGHPYADHHDDSVVVLLGEDATGPRLADAVAGTRYLHLATHGLANSGRDAIYSSVVLTQPRVATSQDTGLLTLQDLFEHWGGKLDGTELVVLSACDSQGIDKGGTNAVTDEGVYGLPWGFWYAGSPAVVASLWEVQDSSTAKLMEQFYRDLQSPSAKTKLAAFTAARKQLKREYPEPFFWAPFIYLGDPN
jgi:tetratricopeptide (TPR) repeat protein/CHAT domain-containing protein